MYIGFCILLPPADPYWFPSFICLASYVGIFTHNEADINSCDSAKCTPWGGGGERRLWVTIFLCVLCRCIRFIDPGFSAMGLWLLY